MQYQQNYKPLIETAKSNIECLIEHFHGSEKKYSIICRKH